jgi:hydroxymethylpyrimidine/phosphomethylpyrimidine kinase
MKFYIVHPVRESILSQIAEFPPIVMTLAGADPSGGAGIQADILTLASLGCHPLSVITAVTVQDTRSVENFWVMDAEQVSDQARFLLEDMPVSVFKVGMIGSVENAAVIAEIAADYPDVPLILDPVLASGGGDELAREELCEAIRDLLLPLTTLITPNSIEARRLAASNPDEEDELSLPQAAQRLLQAGVEYVLITPNSIEARRLAASNPDEEDELSLPQAAQRLLQAGVEYVLITGTHDNTVQVCNTLYHRSGMTSREHWPRLPGSYHGSGCTLASAIAGSLANGLSMPDAVREAQAYTWETLNRAFRPGMGQAIPDRLFWARGDATAEDEAPAAGEPDGLA